MRAFKFRPIRRSFLQLEHLEDRSVPAGVVSANLSAAGLLTIVGDDQANVFTLDLSGASPVLSPDLTTDVGAGPGVDFPVSGGTAKSLKVALAGGNDSVTIANVQDFILTGSAKIDLGDGNNTLNLTTNKKIELGSLSYTGGDGTDTVSVVAGAGLGKVTGAASFNFGLGNSTTTLTEMKFTGPQGLKLTNTGGTSSLSTLTATKVEVSKAVSVASKGNYQATFGLSTIGSVSGKGLTVVVNLNTTTVKGNVKLNTMFTSSVNGNSANINGNIDLIGRDPGLGFAITSWIGTNNVTGHINQFGAWDAALTMLPGANMLFAGDVSLRGEIGAVTTSGALALTINGNLKMRGRQMNASFATTAQSEVKGNLKITSGIFPGSTFVFTTNRFFRADKDVSLSFGNPNATVTIGDGVSQVLIAGNLRIKSENGNDTITLNNVAVSKTTTIATGAGADTLTIDRGSVFTGTFSADVGAGDDIVAIAQSTGAPAELVFNAKTTIKAGDGNDTLRLGLATGGPGGDTFSKAVFAAGGTIDGGAGYNQFDGLTPAQSPSQYTGLTAVDFLNWTDPNP